MAFELWGKDDAVLGTATKLSNSWLRYYAFLLTKVYDKNL